MATRYEKRACCYAALVTIACLSVAVKNPTPMN